MRHLPFCALLSILASTAWADSKCPDVLVVLDASDSMNNSPGGGVTDSKITIAREVIASVLLGNRDAGVPPADARIRFGYTYFPSTNCASGPTAPLPVPCGFGTEVAIVGTVEAQTLHNSTPTAEALEAARATSDLQDASRPRFVVLITDGLPTCGNDAGGRAIGAVDDLSTQGVTTFVVGFGSEAATAERTLSGMAAAGQPPLADGGGAPYYQANDGTTLAEALSDILGRAGSELGGSSCDPCADATCTSSERCVLDGGAPTCVFDPCLGLSCAAGQYCLPAGATASCVGACTAGCPTGQACQAGACVADGCNRGTCRTCSDGQVAEIDGGCGSNFCASLHCPSDAPVCLYGACSAVAAPDAGTTTGGTGGTGSAGGTGGNKSVTASGCGCSSTDAIGLLAICGAALAFATRARRRS